MNIGVVGAGNMGSSLIQGMYLVLGENHRVYAFNRTKKKLLTMKADFHNLIVCDQMELLAEKSDILILAVPHTAIQSFSNVFLNKLREKCVLTVALCGYVPMKILESCLHCKIAKAYPNINWAVGRGATIVNFGKLITKGDKEKIMTFFSKLGVVHEIGEEHFRAMANLMSCGPALWIKIIDLFVAAHEKKYGIDYKLGLELSEKTIEGTFQLMKEKNLDVAGLMREVAGPGGVTEVGLDFINSSFPDVFSNLIEVMDMRDKKRIIDLKMRAL